MDSVAAELQFISARFVRFSGPIRVVLWFNFRNIMYVKEQKCYCLCLSVSEATSRCDVHARISAAQLPNLQILLYILGAVVGGP